ncbi:integrase core domain-containing protein [Streptomyces sp. NPDC005728]|uniref:integrase core domain-containing protein n=1 Tax=Streptomyces sp. NPDC005728 TaxID=3157054 RepID=UPI0033F71C9B
MAIWRRRPTSADLTGLTPHSDRGVQYRALRYTERLGQEAPVASVGSKGDSYDNALAEACNSLFKAELIRNKGPWTGITDIEVAVAEYIDWFNQRRLHGELGHVTPAEHEAAHYLTLEPPASLLAPNPYVAGFGATPMPVLRRAGEASGPLTASRFRRITDPVPTSRDRILRKIEDHLGDPRDRLRRHVIPSWVPRRRSWPAVTRARQRARTVGSLSSHGPGPVGRRAGCRCSARSPQAYGRRLFDTYSEVVRTSA